MTLDRRWIGGSKRGQHDYDRERKLAKRVREVVGCSNCEVYCDTGMNDHPVPLGFSSCVAVDHTHGRAWHLWLSKSQSGDNISEVDYADACDRVDGRRPSSDLLEEA